MDFNFAAAIAARPGGETTAQLVAAYGNPEGPGASPSTQGGAWFNPSPAWVRQNIVLIPLAQLPGFPRCPYGTIKGVSLHRLVAPVFKATWDDLVQLGLHTRLKTFDGSVAYRHMGHNRSRPLSVHAFGAAVDFDAVWNAYGVPLERMQIDRDVVEVFERRGWCWGGRWTGAYADGMHFQWTDPLSGVQLPEWQDALARPVVPPAPAVQQRSLYSRNRSPSGALLDSWTSILVDAQGRVLLGADRQPRTYLMTPEQAAARGLK